MALQLFKLAGEPLPSITTSQASFEYFHTLSDTLTLAANVSLSLASSTWVIGDGTTASVAGFATGQACERLSINGVLQQSGLYSVAATVVKIIAPAAGLSLSGGYPITLETCNTNAIVSTTRTYAVP